jgi:hypothetical protein
MTAWHITADYLENCNCDLLCPCLFAVAPTEGDRMGGGLIFPLYPVEKLDSMAIACYFYLS